MIYNHLFVPLGVDSTPIGQRKQIAAPLGAALISGGASLIGNLLGIGSQKSANESNLQATRETNQMNYQIAQEANRLSSEQFAQNINWLKEQYYDTDQYARLRQSLVKGGLNPALAYGSASPVSSVGQASPTSFHTAQMEAGHVDPISYDSLSQSVGSAVNAYYDNQLKSTQADSVRLDNAGKQLDLEIRGIENYLKISQMIQSLENSKKQGKQTDKEIEYKDKLIESLKDQKRLLDEQFEDLAMKPFYENRLAGAQADDALSAAALKEAQKRAVEHGIKLTVAQIAAVAYSIKDAIERLQMDKDFQQADMAEKRNRVIGMIYDQAEKFERVGMDKEMMDSQKFKNYVGSVADGLGMAIGVRSAVKSGPKRDFNKVPSPLAPEMYDHWTTTHE